MKKVIKIITITLMVLMFTSFVNIAYADDIDPDDFKDIYNQSGTSTLSNKTGQIINIVQIAGTGISVIALIVLGIKYILSSPNEKATVKEQLIPYVIGAIIFFAASNLVAIVIGFAQGISA